MVQADGLEVGVRFVFGDGRRLVDAIRKLLRGRACEEVRPGGIEHSDHVVWCRGHVGVEVITDVAQVRGAQMAYVVVRALLSQLLTAEPDEAQLVGRIY